MAYGGKDTFRVCTYWGVLNVSFIEMFRILQIWFWGSLVLTIILNNLEYQNEERFTIGADDYSE